jgi:hypothetical protein
MPKNFSFNEVVTIISDCEDLKKFKGHSGIITGIAKDDDDDFIHYYGVDVFNDVEGVQEILDCDPEDLISTGKIAHQKFNQSNLVLRVSNGDITDVIAPPQSYFILMSSLTTFFYEEDVKRIKVTVKNEVLEDNKSYEILNKSLFSKWDSGEKISLSKQVEILKNFKEGMLTTFGIEIDYE